MDLKIFVRGLFKFSDNLSENLDLIPVLKNKKYSCHSRSKR
jgi:hypothetical protein